MKISIGSKIKTGPWGGGNLFVKNLSNYLLDNGHEVVYDLLHLDIDVILLTDPRPRRLSSSTFNHKDIKYYKKFINPKVKVVQRINECDERKSTEGVNELYLKASHCSDRIVFVSEWLKSIYLKLGIDINKSTTILSGANHLSFNTLNSQVWNGLDKINLVTHHWSANRNKGLETYLAVDKLLDKAHWSKKLNFTYIGNVSKEFKFKNTKVIKPLEEKNLAEELKKHHVYITGSINEPSGNHHVEAAQCGLPILYLESGGVTEYCKSYGLPFQNENLETVLEQLIKDYKHFKNRLRSYPLTADITSGEFVKEFESLLKLDQKNYESNNNLFFIYIFFAFQRFKRNFIQK
jgi:hypothetical protein